MGKPGTPILLKTPGESGDLPAVTIVTPSLNQGAFIRATIESVLAQDYPHVEYIIMDGGSTDETPAIASEYAGRLTWISEKDDGQAHAINKGFRMGRGAIVAWINSDDVLLPDAVRHAVTALRSAPRAAAVYGEGLLMDRHGRHTRRFPATEPFNLWKLVYELDYILQQSTFFRRSAVQAVGWLDEGLHYALDWDLLIRLGKRYELRYIPELLGALREYPEAKSFCGGHARTEEIRKVLARHTGMKRAPGYWNYALHAWQQYWADRLNARATRWPRSARILRRALDVSTQALLLARAYPQGLYPGRWAAPRVKWMLPEGKGEALIRGNLPDDPKLAGQRILVTISGKAVANWEVPAGRFDLRFPAASHSGEPLLLEIQASKSVHHPFHTDRRGASFRSHSYLLDSITWADD